MGRIAARECIPDFIAQEKAKLVVVCWAPNDPPPPPFASLPRQSIFLPRLPENGAGGGQIWFRCTNRGVKRGAAWRSHFWDRPYKFGLRGGPENGPLFCQPNALWRRSKFMHARVPVGQEPLLVKMDETSIRLHQSHGEGHLVHTAAVQNQSSRHIPGTVNM